MIHPQDTNRGHFPEVVDSTILAEWKACEAKAHFAHFRNLGPPYKSVDLVAGGAFATGLEHIRKGVYGEKLSLEDAFRKAVPHVIAAFGDVEVPEHKAAKGLDRIIEGLIAYFQKFPPHEDAIQPYMVDGWPSVEFRFAIPLPLHNPETGMPLIYGGRFDMLGVFKDQLVVLDEKTASQLGPTWSSKWNLRGQFTGYCWGARQYGKPVVGAIARGVAFYKKDYGFEQSLQMRSDDQIEMWYEETLETCKRMIAAWESNSYHQDFADACAAYSGCPFQSLCQVKDYEPWIAGKFGIRKWNPLDKDPEQIIETQTMDTISLADAMKF